MLATDFVNPSSLGCPSNVDPSEVIRNYFNISQYRCRTQFFTEFPLSVGIGYAVVLAFGLAFGLATVALVYLDQYLFRRNTNSEYFNTAGRSVRTGLTASVIVSQWTWAATLLKSSEVAFKYGISGPLWYAAGSTVQVILFSTMAVMVKLRAPTAHTFLEIIRARWGTVAHLVFLTFALLNNIIVTSLLVLGASASVEALTGMNVDVASVLVPLGVILYTLAGGLKATFVASYFNTAVMLVSLLIVMFRVYVTSPDLGSSDVLFDNLTKVAIWDPVEDNRNGSYLTMFSRNGFFFGLVNLVGSFGTVFIDQSYWQSAIAATPSASWKGYLLGGLCWFAIPFSFATSLGLAAVARSLPISDVEAERGLVPPAAAVDLMGKGGASVILIMLFMAVVSSGAAEQIAVSSIVAYDIYRTYINPNCSGRRVIYISRIVIFAYGLVMGVFAVALHYIGVSLGFLYRAMGVFIGPAVVPVVYSIMWGRASGLGAMLGALVGLVCGLSVWFGYGASFEGGVTIDNLFRDEVMLSGNLVSILSSGVMCTVVSLVRPDDCDWSTTRAIALIEDDPNAHIPFEAEEALERALKRIGILGVGITFLLVICWPALTLPVGVFSKGYFKFWVIISFMWGIASCALMVGLPLIESRHGILAVLSGGNYAHQRKGKRDREQDESVEDFVIEDR